MSVERVKDRQIIPPGDWETFYTRAEYAFMVPVQYCVICGDDLLDHDFVFWRGNIPLGFHPSCARHMCLGLLRDIAELTHYLAHDAKPLPATQHDQGKEQQIATLQSSLRQTQDSLTRYARRIIELQELMARRD